MFVSDVKFEEVKQAVYKALPLLLIWSMLVISLHIFYPYFVWWPRRILWVDYAILFGVAKVIKGIPAAIKWLFGRPYFAGLTFEDTPDKPDTPGDQGG